jgi:multimeric flavodoxin WrbA
VVADALEKDGVTVDWVRAVDHDIKPGVERDMGDGDAWPAIRRQILSAEILIIATPTWVGRPSSLAQRVLERMDAMISETDERGRPVAYDRVAGVVNTGNEDGAHHVISEISGALGDIGFTIPGQAWTYWHLGPGAGPDYLDDQRGHDWAAKTGRAVAANLTTVARALAATPIQGAAGLIPATRSRPHDGKYEIGESWSREPALPDRRHARGAGRPGRRRPTPRRQGATPQPAPYLFRRRLRCGLCDRVMEGSVT